jgi:hypothetical protein
MSNPASNTASILQKNKKVLIASLTGSAIEWFDYFLYGTAAALVFNKIFFPMVDPVIGLILSWLSFSLTFLSAPSAASFSPISAIASAARRRWC